MTTKNLPQPKRSLTRDREKLQEQVIDLQRQLQSKTSNELGEITELQVLDDLRSAFTSDNITGVAKGSPGGDILVEVVNLEPPAARS